MNEIQQLLASCQAHLASLDTALDRIAEVIGDVPKAEPQVRWFYSPRSTAMRKIVNGLVYCKFVDFPIDSFTEDVHSADDIIKDFAENEITADQAEAILKGGGL